jgi:hypothetical protein
MLKPSPLAQGYNDLWPTPVKLVNLLEQGIVSEELHARLEKYADDPRLATGPYEDLYDKKKLYARLNLTVFISPVDPELVRIKEILVGQADQYARETVADPLPEHEKLAVLWFAIQHPGNPSEVITPHYHEGGDVAFVYYLATPSDGSGTIVMVDPRGAVERGSRALGRAKPVIEYSPRRGELLVIPRYVMHYTSLNTDTHARKVIAGVVAYERPRRDTVRFLFGG